MSEENVETMRAAYERTAHGDFSGLAEVTEDFEFVTSPEMPDPGTYRGEDADRYRQGWLDSFEGLTMEATELVAAGDQKVAGSDAARRGSGSN
jgi:ketosteroid isomerase-like protein